MKKQRTSQSGIFQLRVLLAVLLCSAGVFLSFFSFAASPPTGALTEANTSANPLTYTAGPFAVSNPTDQVSGFPDCSTLPCDDFALTVSVPAGYDTGHFIKLQLNWPNPAAEYDLFVYKKNANNSLTPIAANFFAVDPDVASIPAVSGNYVVRIAPTIALGDTTSAKITVEDKLAPLTQGSGTAPAFQNFKPTSPLGDRAGEPSLGVDFKTNIAFFQAVTRTLRVTFNDNVSPATALWEDKSAPNSAASLDPILFTDRQTGRTFASQLAGACSSAAFTDDDANSWTPSQGCGVPAGVDHQTLGGGPLAAPLTRDPKGAVYPDGVYYCSQYGTNAASCAISLDGGLNFGPAVPIYQVSCFGIHGHVKVAPNDGTAYVPNSDCSSGPSGTARQGLVFSEDNGITWSAPQLIPNSNPAPGIVDPSIGLGANGTIYYGFADGSGSASVAVGKKSNHQITWAAPQDVGAALGLKSVTFPEVVAGDDDRAAFAFLGSTTGGYYQDPANFTGVWYLFVATTYDGGNSWITVNATPNDPVQRGSICNSGTVICSHTPNDRNLLDFMDETVDAQGRIMVGYADGCITSGCIAGGANDFTRKASIARQTDGRRLFAAFDAVPSSVVSRKTHGAVDFDVNLPLTGTRGIEPRSGGATNDEKLVFTFPNVLTSVAGASVTAGAGSVSSSAIGPNPNQYTVNLTGVTNAQYITVTLSNVRDTASHVGDVSVAMGVLVGDVNATGVVDGNDVSAVQGNTRQPVNASTFRYDVNVTGSIDGNDVSATQAKTRTRLP